MRRRLILGLMMISGLAPAAQTALFAALSPTLLAPFDFRVSVTGPEDNELYWAAPGPALVMKPNSPHGLIIWVAHTTVDDRGLFAKPVSYAGSFASGSTQIVNAFWDARTVTPGADCIWANETCLVVWAARSGTGDVNLAVLIDSNTGAVLFGPVPLNWGYAEDLAVIRDPSTGHFEVFGCDQQFGYLRRMQVQTTETAILSVSANGLYEFCDESTVAWDTNNQEFFASFMTSSGSPAVRHLNADPSSTVYVANVVDNRILDYTFGPRSLAFDPSTGRALLVFNGFWAESINGGAAIFGQILELSGARGALEFTAIPPLQFPISSNYAVGENARRPSVTFDPASGNFLVVYDAEGPVSGLDEEETQAFLQIVDPNGSLVLPAPLQISEMGQSPFLRDRGDPQDFFFARDPAVAVGGGQALIAWHGNDLITRFAPFREYREWEIWGQFVDISGLIFADGFELGDTSAWE